MNSFLTPQMGRLLSASAICATLILTSAHGQVLYDSDFDSLNAGQLTPQDGWIHQSGSAAQAVIETNSGVAFSGSNYMQLTGTAGADVWVRKNMPSNTLSDTQNNNFNFVFRTDAVGSVTNLTFSAGGNLGGVTMMEAQIEGPGNRIFVSTNGGSFNTIVNPSTAIQADTWYDLNVLLSPSTKTYQMTLTNTSNSSVILDSNFAFKDTVPTYTQFYSILYANSSGGGNDWLVDDIVVSSVPEPSSLSLVALCGFLLTRRSLRRRRDEAVDLV